MQQIPHHRIFKTKNVMEILMSLQDSFIVFLMYLIGKFHKFINNIKIELILNICVYIFFILFIYIYI